MSTTLYNQDEIRLTLDGIGLILKYQGKPMIKFVFI